jgi:hypothetical protein
MPQRNKSLTIKQKKLDGRIQKIKRMTPVLNAKHMYFNYGFEVRMEEVDPNYKRDNDSLEDKLQQTIATTTLRKIVYENFQSELLGGLTAGLWAGMSIIRTLHPFAFLGGIACSVGYSLLSYGIRDMYYNSRDLHWVRDRVIWKFNEYLNDGLIFFSFFLDRILLLSLLIINVYVLMSL